MQNTRKLLSKLTTYFWIGIFIFSFTLVKSADVSGELKKWHAVTLTFTGPNNSETGTPNPFTDYRLNVTFTSPGGNTYVIPGFYAADGSAGETGATTGNKWQCRFTPDETGTWSYSASFRTGSNINLDKNATAGSATSFDGDAGTFDVQATDKSGVDLRGKGMAKYVNKHYIQFAETGEYFIKGGADSPENFLGYYEFDGTYDGGGTDLDGLGADQLHNYTEHGQDYNATDASDYTWQGGKGKNILGAIAYLSSKGMNSIYFLTFNKPGDGQDTWPWLDWDDYYHFDCSKLDQWEKVFSYMDKKGIMMHVVLQEQENDQTLGLANDDRRLLYFKEMIARFGHHLNVQWNIGEENTNTDAEVTVFAEWIRYWDAYKHPIALHIKDNRLDRWDPFYGEPYMEAASIQSEPETKCHDQAVEVFTKSSNANRPWACYEDEQNKLGVTPFVGNLESMRKEVLWGNLMGNGAGVEWYFYYYDGEDWGDLEQESWRTAASLWEHTDHALDFFQAYVPFWEMSPADNLVSNSSAWCSAKEGEAYVVYLKNGGTTNITINVDGTYWIKWYDPRDGGSLQDGTVGQISGTGVKSIGNAPYNTSSDWAVLIMSNTAGQFPSASFSTNVTSGERPLAVSFDASSSNDPDGSIASYEWDFGDGNTGTGQTVSHTYDVVGTFTATLTVTDNEGNTSSSSTQISVQLGAGEDPCQLADFEEQNGLVVMEVESVGPETGWVYATSPAGFTGNGYYKWEGGDNFGSPGKGLLEYTFYIHNPGQYHFKLRNMIGVGSSMSESNDCWLRMPDADDFYAGGGTLIVRPKPDCSTDCPQGASGDGWLKAYTKGGLQVWTYDIKTSDGENLPIYADFNSAGIYTLQLSGRADGHFIDRIVLYNTAMMSMNDAIDDANQETVCNGTTPIVSITSPTNNEVFGEPADVNITATANDPDGAITNVDFYNGTTLLGSDNIDPYAYNWQNVSPGTYTIEVVATDNEGNNGSRSVNITVEANTTPEISSLSLPTGSIGTTYNATLLASGGNGMLTWSVDSGAVPDGLSLNANGTITGTPTTVGLAGFKVRVTDIDGDFGTKTMTIDILDAPNVPPTVTITSPANGTIIPPNSNYTISVDAADSDGSVTNVIIYIDDNQVADLSSAPYTYEWANIPAGEYTVSAAAVDNDGDMTVTAYTNVTVANIQTYQYEAEDYTGQNGCTEKAEGEGYSGTGWMDYGSSGSYIEWNNVTAPTAEAEITFTYSNGDATRNCDLVVNGVNLGNIDFNTTGTWNVDWGSTTVFTVTLDAGVANTIRLLQTSNGGPNVDFMTVNFKENQVTGVTGISVDPTSGYITIGETISLTETITPSNASNKTVSWSSSDGSVATVDNSGNVTGVAVGTVTITVTSNDSTEIFATASITVSNVPITGIEISNCPAGSIPLGDAMNLDEVITPSDATDKSVSWSTSDNSIATVDNDGLVLAVGLGTATITVTSSDGSLTSNCSFVVEDTITNSIQTRGIEQWVFPNPTTGQVFIKPSGMSVRVIKIFDVSGQIVKKFDEINRGEQLSLNISELVQGIYFVEISGKDHRSKARIIKQ